jgi:SAM-dependent methyltransferase
MMVSHGLRPGRPTPTPVPGYEDFCGGDLCVGFFTEMFAAGRIPIPQGAKVLEIGCAEVDWLTPMKARRPDLTLVGVDQRQHEERPGADLLVRGDLMQRALFKPATFDVAIAISVIEHVGIGRYGDPVERDGDSMAMANLHYWLKPDGFLYMDVPYRHDGLSTEFRAYNETDLQKRVIHGWTEVDREYFTGNGHPDGPYIALVLKP